MAFIRLSESTTAAPLASGVAPPDMPLLPPCGTTGMACSAHSLSSAATAAVEPGARVPRVDLVLETVGRATWSHSLRSVRPGGTVVVAGATSGDPTAAELTRVFFQEIAVLGVTMGSRDDLRHLLAFLARTGVRPLVDRTYPLTHARDAVARLAAGEQFGKIVVTP